MQKIIEIRNGIVRNPEWSLNKPVNFSLADGEHIAILGPNGGGKSLLVDIITGKHPLCQSEVKYDFSPSTSKLASENIRHITLYDSYGEGDSTYYLQKRWNQHEIEDDLPTASQLLDKECNLAGLNKQDSDKIRHQLTELFNMSELLTKPILMLSSGELRKFQLTRALLSKPRVLIIESPFIGLDAPSRQQLCELLELLVKQMRIQIILVLSKTDEIPPFITHVVEVEDRCVGQKTEYDTLSYLYEWHKTPLPEATRQWLLSLPSSKDTIDNKKEMVCFNNVTIRYGNHTILDNLSWQVKKGERWALKGRNGSGKSTLLSLICADNPQGYACDIRLFGYQRGQGESIWDIKKNIGYVSPEMHRSYRMNIPALKVVASGLRDSIGLYFKPSEEEIDRCLAWMKVFGIEGLREKPFQHLSSGEQRLALIARAFVKDPDLLILDEPLHGLDIPNRAKVKEIIDFFFSRPEKTLIMVTHYDDELPNCITNVKTLNQTSRDASLK